MKTNKVNKTQSKTIKLKKIKPSKVSNDSLKNLMNRIHNANNPYQGVSKKVLCVCSAGLLRSPTAALVLSQPPYNYNTRACGVDAAFALIPIDDVLLTWADEIVCMTSDQVNKIGNMLQNINNSHLKTIICLNINDEYSYKDNNLIDLIKSKYNDYLRDNN